jgi:crotonobetaine/carnitine-CoA ligase
VTRTIPRHFRAAVDAAADSVWIRSDHITLTYAESLDLVERAAAGLRARGVGPGDRVIVTPRTTPRWVLGWLAVMEVGAVQVPINPESSDAERDGFVHQVRPSLVVDEDDLDALFAAAPDGRGPAELDESDVAVMIPTSGTTGRTKLVMQTHLAYVMAGEGFPYWLGLDADDRLLTSLPLFHVNAPAYSVLGSLGARCGLVLQPAFSASGFLDAARRHGATQFNSIGAMLEILVRQPPRPEDAEHSIRLCYNGPTPDRARQEEIEARFGFELVGGYALSESLYGTVWERGTRPYGTIGSLRQHPELGRVNEGRVVDGEREVGVGEVGELWLRNPATMRGYFRMPDETAAVLRDGWLRTGDLVRLNADDTYTFIGRAKEVIRRRGENLAPVEVEATLERHPDVVEAAVIGVPSELSEEDVKAFLVGVPGRSIDAGAVRAFAAEQLARFKLPRYVEVVDELPHTATGRLAKHLLPRDRRPGELDFGSRGE